MRVRLHPDAVADLTSAGDWFVVESDDVVVLAIAHLRRRPGYWLERRPRGR